MMALAHRASGNAEMVNVSIQNLFATIMMIVLMVLMKKKVIVNKVRSCMQSNLAAECLVNFFVPNF
jgi:hypothetical protein